jgi:hypothetical protein
MYYGYGWIKAKTFKDDPKKSWEERFHALQSHHVEETTFLINEVRRLAMQIDASEPHSEHWGP